VFALFLFLGFINSKKGSDLKLYGSTLLGALSYPIYLVHAHFGYMLISEFGTEKNKYVVYIITVSLVIIVSYFMHILVEKKCSHVWKLLFQKTIGNLISLGHPKPEILLR
jgi:peptidoglycan/LPS O-acetylase OafA/YrhL